MRGPAHGGIVPAVTAAFHQRHHRTPRHDGLPMQFLMLVYSDTSLLDAVPQAEYDTMMRGCLEHADDLHAEGKLVGSRQLEAPSTARTIRTRNGSTTVVDGPFAETKELLAGFNIIEADSVEEAVRIASEFPWSRTGSIEVRPIRDMDAVRMRVGATKPQHAVGSEVL